MHSSRDQNKHVEAFSSLGSDVTAVMASPDEHGSRFPQDNRRDSSKRSSTPQPQSANEAFSPIQPLAYHPRTASGIVETNSVKGAHANGSEQDHIQFANYSEEKLRGIPKIGQPPVLKDRQSRFWVPLPFRPYFWVPLVVFLVLAAIGLEIALYFSNKNQGFPSGQTPRQNQVLHYVYTLPPVIISAMVVAMWAWTDSEIKKIQPYVDLVHGDSPPHRSLLLDYTRYNNLVVWTRATSNRHYLVALASLMVILTLSFQPLAAALLFVQDTWWREIGITIKNQAALGLNQGLQFNDLTAFMTSAGFAGASVMYDLPPPAFVRPPYTVAPFELPTFVTKNGTVFANTTAIKSESGCVRVEVSMFKHPDGRGWTNMAEDPIHQCSITFEVDVSSRILFGTDVPTCTSPKDPQYSPIVFWYFSYIPSALSAATFCYPSISIWDVNVAIDVGTGNVTKVTELRPFSSSSNFSTYSANVTGEPLNGRAYNGITFNLTDSDRFVRARANATQLQLPAAVYQAAVKSPVGFSDSFKTGALTVLSEEIYEMYLSIFARDVYFLPNEEPMVVDVCTFRLRVWLSSVAVHLLATAMLILAFFGTIVHLFHREDRRNLRLRHEPGTIASAVSIGAQTGLGDVLAGRQGDKDIKEALKNKKFRIDPATMKIIMEGEYGYEEAKSPVFEGRGSVIHQILHRPSRRTMGASTPTTPMSPNSQLPQSPNPRSPRLQNSRLSFAPIINAPRTPVPGSIAPDSRPRTPNPPAPDLETIPNPSVKSD